MIRSLARTLLTKFRAERPCGSRPCGAAWCAYSEFGFSGRPSGSGPLGGPADSLIATRCITLYAAGDVTADVAQPAGEFCE
jgi:hypothetical protein